MWSARNSAGIYLNRPPTNLMPSLAKVRRRRHLLRGAVALETARLLRGHATRSTHNTIFLHSASRTILSTPRVLQRGAVALEQGLADWGYGTPAFTKTCRVTPTRSVWIRRCISRSRASRNRRLALSRQAKVQARVQVVMCKMRRQRRRSEIMRRKSRLTQVPLTQVL